MAAKAIKLNFGTKDDTVPTASRESRYQALYDMLEASPGQWADVTDAVTVLAEAVGADAPGAGSSAITLRKQGFEATSRMVDGKARVFAAFIPEEGDSAK